MYMYIYKQIVDFIFYTLYDIPQCLSPAPSPSCLTPTSARYPSLPRNDSASGSRSNYSHQIVVVMVASLTT